VKMRDVILIQDCIESATCKHFKICSPDHVPSGCIFVEASNVKQTNKRSKNRVDIVYTNIGDVAVRHS